MKDLTEEIRSQVGDDWIPQIYELEIRPLRTRSFELDIPEKENSPAILTTLLGIELKVVRHRFACPDMATARYMLIFARLGCREAAIPYDITQIPGIADRLEAAWDKLIVLFESISKGLSTQHKGRLRSKLIKQLREEIKEIGAGTKMPLFNTSTKQRQN